MMRVAQRDELELLSELAMRSKRYWGYSASFLQACRPELTLAEDLLPDTIVKETKDGIVGFYALRPLDGPRVELAFLFVEPAELRGGYGRELLVHARKRAHSRGWSAMIVQSDPHAALFYVRCGAVKIGEQLSGSIPGRVLPVYELAC